MPALLSVTIRPIQPERIKEYIAQVPATMAPFGAKMLSRGKIAKTLLGEQRGHALEAVFEFPDMDALDGWYNSPAYQALAPLRDEVCEMTLAAIEPF